MAWFGHADRQEGTLAKDTRRGYVEGSMKKGVAAFSPLENSPPAVSPTANGPPAKSPPPAAIRPLLA